MKKSLVLAMAMALGVSATAFAANPFSDVPAGHWAYASVAKLAAAGIVDGYPDGTFKGDNLMTRYEMAQIVAKAYAKGAIGADDKLMAEFADELDNLGVRVAKLEKKADNVKITGQVRALYVNNDKDLYVDRNATATSDNSEVGHSATLRTRLWVNGAINDNWTYTAMLQNTQDLTTNAEESTTQFRRAYVTGKVGDVGVIAGRYNYTVGQGNVFDDPMDALQLTFGKVLKASVAVGRTDDTVAANDYENTYVGTLAYTAGATNFDSAYYNFKKASPDATGDDLKIWTVGANGEIAKNLSLGAEYLKSNTEALGGNDDGYVVTMSYKGANAAQKGSFGVWTKYYDQASTTYVLHTTDATHGKLDENGGFKGIGAGVNYTLAKNIVGIVEYYDLDSKANDFTTRTLWSEIDFTF